MTNSRTNDIVSNHLLGTARQFRLSKSLLLLGISAALSAPACSSSGIVTGPCSRDDECGTNAYCVHSQCVSGCSRHDDCEASQRCLPHPNLPSAVSACFVNAVEGDAAPSPFGCEGRTDTGGSGSGTSAAGGAAVMGGMPGEGGLGGAEAGGSAPFTCEGAGVTGPDSVFVEGGLGTSGPWQGYFHSFSASSSEVYPDCFSTEQVCVQGTLAAGYDQWVNVGFNIAQDVDPETLEGGEVRAISPGGDGVRVEVENFGGSSLRVQIQADLEANEFWCAPLPLSGSGVLRWEDFRKECWLPGGEQYDGVTPIVQIVVQSYATSDSQPTLFHYCLIDIAPYVER